MIAIIDMDMRIVGMGMGMLCTSMDEGVQDVYADYYPPGDGAANAVGGSSLGPGTSTAI
jgi:hypothetical protein